jgi:multisubunit Na+/H+ antiporter MnhB subunit
MNANENDKLKDLFGRLPEVKLPAAFRAEMMKKIAAEAARRRKRSERLSWAALIAASLAVLGLAVAALRRLGVFQTLSQMPEIHLSFPEIERADLGLSLFVGGLVLLLLCADHLLRRKYNKL